MKKLTGVIIILLVMLTGILFWAQKKRSADDQAAQTKAAETDEQAAAQAETAAHTPFGAYPDTVTYTLGKISSQNNANMPAGDNYEYNAYTRYLKEMLNIQNEDLFELEDGDAYNERVDMAIQDRSIPDVMVVNGRDTLEVLAANDMVADLTTVFEECTTDRIKEMYGSYGSELLDSAVFDGKLYGIPDTVIDHGPCLLWLRKDWMDALGLDEPETMAEAVGIIRQFAAHDMAGDGKTTGILCSTDIISKNSSTYSLDPLFTMYHSVPGEWTVTDGKVGYGSLTPETKEALAYLQELFAEGVIDQQFMLRTSENLDDILAAGECGAVFGYWWSPNNPLYQSYSSDRTAQWMPYFLTDEQENSVQTLSSYDDCKYVVVRKGYGHPEIAAKIISVLYDYTSYTDKNAEEINSYFSQNVDPVARPLTINVDYRDAIYQVNTHLTQALSGELAVSALTGLEKSYYNTCQSYINRTVTTANAWSAYASRVQAVGLLNAQGFRSGASLAITEAETSVPAALKNFEKETFLQIICGEKSIDYFDTFVREWNDRGGRALTVKLQEAYDNNIMEDNE